MPAETGGVGVAMGKGVGAALKAYGCSAATTAPKELFFSYYYASVNFSQECVRRQALK